MEREKIIRKLSMQINSGGHIIGAAVGSGLTAKLAALGGADILLALSAGKYRIMGRSSFSSYFCYGNNNSQVMELGISFAKLADGANISRTYLSQRFKEEIGVAFSDYLLSFRLNKAREILLREKNIPCKEVALRVGYTDYAQFTKMFKKFIGDSPNDYRKKFACV